MAEPPKATSILLNGISLCQLYRPFWDGIWVDRKRIRRIAVPLGTEDNVSIFQSFNNSFLTTGEGAMEDAEVAGNKVFFTVEGAKKTQNPQLMRLEYNYQEPKGRSKGHRSWTVAVIILLVYSR